MTIRVRSWLSALAVLALLCETAFAAVELKAPESAAKGDAFLVSAISDKPVERFVFHWLGKDIDVKAVPTEGGRYAGDILLPVPLDEKSSRMNLEARAGGPETARATIKIYEKQRPSQKLKVDKKFVRTPPEVQERIKADREKVRLALQDRLPDKLWALPFEKPVPGGVSSLFGMKRVFNGELKSVHKGLDLRGAAGTPIKACADGRVALSDNLYYSGNTVYLNHGDGVFTAYLHMSKPLVKTGDMVKKGDVIGLVGATGRVTGPHLHLSLIAQGQSVDPQPMLEDPTAKKAGGAR
ncbi:MAG: M23 family metallopeptidase [Desulfovibrio sp.]|nr:M23 family metallopeptidase [Desulfovibrio sp.]